MIRLNNILTILLFCLTLASCGQSTSKQQSDKTEQQKQVENKYTKVISDPTNKPTDKVETLTLSYNAISCTCAQWSENRKSEDTYKKQNYWLEPANEKLINADTLFKGENLPIIIKVTGQLITETGFPKRELAKVGKKEAGKVFRYTKLEVIQNGQKKNGR